MEEIWKDILDFPNYEVSNLGRIRNKKSQCLLTPSANKHGYFHVGLYNEHGRSNVFVHRAVAIAFCDGYEPVLQVNHIDGDKSHNIADNLEWCTASENVKHAFDTGLKQPLKHPNAQTIKIVETGEVFDSIRHCALAVNGDRKSIKLCLDKKQDTHHGLHYEYIDKKELTPRHPKPFLYPHQQEAVEKMFNGCVLNGTVGSGKSRVGLYYYFSKYGGSIVDQKYTPMRVNPKPPDLYILTTAKKRNDLEWEQEMIPFLLSTDPKQNLHYGNKIVVDSWQNIKKYADITGAFFILDENKINGKGIWAKSFLKIAKNNEWIILSASNGDRWEDYETLFIAEGFFRTRTEFRNEHLRYSNYTSFPKVTGYINETRLFRLRERILIDMDFKRDTVAHHEDVYVKYDIPRYKDAIRNRWDPYKNEPIQQASGLCYVLRRIVNEDQSRQVALLELLENHPKAIIFYNFDNELDILLNLAYQDGTEVAQYNGHKHEPIPLADRWVYLVNYNACEAWNTTRTDTMIFFSQNYSYKVMTQAAGRIDRLITPYTDLYYYHLKSRSGIDLAISKALREKKKFNERKFTKWK